MDDTSNVGGPKEARGRGADLDESQLSWADVLNCPIGNKKVNASKRAVASSTTSLQ